MSLLLVAKILIPKGFEAPRMVSRVSYLTPVGSHVTRRLQWRPSSAAMSCGPNSGILKVAMLARMCAGRLLFGMAHTPCCKLHRIITCQQASSSGRRTRFRRRGVGRTCAGEMLLAFAMRTTVGSLSLVPFGVKVNCDDGHNGRIFVYRSVYGFLP